MSRRPCQNYSQAFKAKVAMEALIFRLAHHRIIWVD